MLPGGQAYWAALCTLSLAWTSQTCCLRTDSLPPGSPPFFFFFFPTGKQQLSPCGENKPECCSGPAGHGAAGQSAFLHHLPTHHNLSGASAVFLPLWPTLELVSYLPDSQWTLCLLGPSSLRWVGVAASVWLVSSDCECKALPLYSMFCFSMAAVWYSDLWPCVLLWFVVSYESLRGFEGGCSFADITVTKVFSDGCSVRNCSSQSFLQIEQVEWEFWQIDSFFFCFVWKCVCSTEF